MSTQTTDCTLRSAATDELLDWAAAVAADRDDDFEAAKVLSTRLGAHWNDDGYAEVGFWVPELADADIETVYLEVLTPTGDVDLAADEQHATFDRDLVALERQGEYAWGAVEGMVPGDRDRLGSLYQLAYEADGEWERVPDPLAYSVPFGAFAPAELYDIETLDAERDDRDYFRALGTDDEPVPTTDDDGIPRIDPGTGMLELHPGTATEAGSLGGLAREYETIADKQRAGEDLTPAERNFAGYDAVQVMPIEPITENEEAADYWAVEDGAAPEADAAEVTLRKPDMVNWGYDIVVSAFSAVNPAILETGRPDELVDFIEACHDMPTPIRVVFDIALGHADDGALDLLNDYFLEGPGMYGQELDYTQPTARAVFLEMQRRKMDFGADGIRVDGAQDFTNWDPEAEEEWHDDEFLAEMDAVVQEVAGQQYRPWMIYEDGRPWPRDDWELAATYRTLIEQHPHSFQWSPITFAHNTPALLTFWATKWWRVREVADIGSQWLTGVANHDTIRRGTQIDPTVQFNQSPVNTYLGDSLPEILDRAYNNPASNMLFYCFMPGVPMDFVHANMRAPWGFIRDTDAIWNVKVVSEESNFIDWQLTEDAYQQADQFTRLKSLGFEDIDELRTFVRALDAAVDVTDYDLEAIARMLDPLTDAFGDTDPEDVDAFARAWMQDVHDYCNLSHYRDRQDPDRTAFDLEVREFRQSRPWLQADVGDRDGEFFDYRHPSDGTVLYYGVRRAPDDSEELLFVGNMEGVTVDVDPTELPIPELSEDGWEVALSSPGASVSGPDSATLSDSEAVVLSPDAGVDGAERLHQLSV